MREQSTKDDVRMEYLESAVRTCHGRQQRRTMAAPMARMRTHGTAMLCSVMAIALAYSTIQ